MRYTRSAWVVLVLVLTAAATPAADSGGKKRRPLPHEFGRVVLNNTSEKSGLAPVVFDHWLHRAKFTCRLCHVDVGFAMAPGATGITAADNAAGFYCGACHDGKARAGGGEIFASCDPTKARSAGSTCLRCHSSGKTVPRAYDFAAFTKGFPKGRFGNGVDWEKAEEAGLVRPVDLLPGVSIPRATIAAQKDFDLTPEQRGMPEILFSHAKHTVWNGCELCHPDIFGAVKKGSVRFTMQDIFDGRSCGACHVTVAFPLTDCQRCHVKPVEGP